MENDPRVVKRVLLELIVDSKTILFNFGAEKECQSCLVQGTDGSI